MTEVRKETSAPRSGTDTVTVALKCPSGIALQAFEMVESGMDARDANGRGGPVARKVAQPVGDPFRLNGNAVAAGATPHCSIVGGFALTHGVPKDLWENWLKFHQDHPLVKNGLILAYDTRDKAKDASKDRRDLRSGLEPITPDTDPRLPRKRNRDGSLSREPGVVTADARAPG